MYHLADYYAVWCPSNNPIGSHQGDPGRATHITTAPARKPPACQMIHCEKDTLILLQLSAFNRFHLPGNLARKTRARGKLRAACETHKTVSGFWTLPHSTKSSSSTKGAENDSAESEKSVFFFALVRGQFATFPRDKRIELIFAVDLSGPTDGRSGRD